MAATPERYAPRAGSALSDTLALAVAVLLSGALVVGGFAQLLLRVEPLGLGRVLIVLGALLGLFFIPLFAAWRLRRRTLRQSWLELREDRLTGRLPTWRGFRPREPLRDIDLPIDRIGYARVDSDIYRYLGLPVVYERWAIEASGELVVLEVCTEAGRMRTDIARAQPDSGRGDPFAKEGWLGPPVVRRLVERRDLPVAAPVYRRGGEALFAWLFNRGAPTREMAMNPDRAARMHGAYGVIMRVLLLITAFLAAILLLLRLAELIA